jgi:hypothetical protein
MERNLGRLSNKSCLVYVDDILIFTKTCDKLLMNYEKGKCCRSSKGESIYIGKSKFMAEEINLLGHSIGANRLMATEMDLATFTNLKGQH